MKFLADENVSHSVVKELRSYGFDIKCIGEENLKGVSDQVLIDFAFKQDRIIITHDKNFGNLLAQQNMKHKGAIIVRCKNQHYINVFDILIKFINSNLIKKCKDAVVILSEDNVIVYR